MHASFDCEMMRSALSNSAALDRWVMSRCGDHERRLDRHRVDLVDGFLQRAQRVGIGRLVEADMTVAELEKGHARRGRGRRLRGNPMCTERTAARRRLMVQSTPVPAQGHAFSTLRRLTPVLPLGRVRSSHVSVGPELGFGEVSGGREGTYSRLR